MSNQVTIADSLTTIVSSLVTAGVPLQAAMRAVEMKFIDIALTLNAGNITRASRQLGIHRNTLMNKRRRRIAEILPRPTRRRR